jgi:hypothetical protein
MDADHSAAAAAAAASHRIDAAAEGSSDELALCSYNARRITSRYTSFSLICNKFSVRSGSASVSISRRAQQQQAVEWRNDNDLIEHEQDNSKNKAIASSA